MRVLLVSANTERLNMPTLPVGLAWVAAAVRRAGHDVAFLDLMREEAPEAALADAVVEARPDVIGVSVRNIDDQEWAAPRLLVDAARGVVETCRARSDAPVVLGGAGYSILPDAVLARLGADYGVRGDGEVVFPVLLDRLERGEDVAGLPGVHVAGRGGAAAPDFLDDLDALAGPDEGLWAGLDPAAPDLWVPVQSRRGCPNDCAYCSTASVQGRRIRCRSPELTVEDVERLARAGFSRFYFVDNSFNLPEPHALELCRLLREVRPRVTWRCILYPHRIGEELVRALAGAGCVEVALGFESGNERVLQELNKRFGPADVERASALLARHGIRRMGFLLLGGPGETRASVHESLTFAESLGLETLRITAGIRLYPGTPLARRAAAEGVIAPDDDLLEPRFYVAPGLGPWLRDNVSPGVRPGGPPRTR